MNNIIIGKHLNIIIIGFNILYIAICLDAIIANRTPNMNENTIVIINSNNVFKIYKYVLPVTNSFPNTLIISNTFG